MKTEVAKPVSGIQVRGVLLPLQGGQLLVPNAAVTEVIGFKEPEIHTQMVPGWLLGTQIWRNQIIPVVMFEKLVGYPVQDIGHRARLAVCNTLNGNPRRPYIGIVLRAIPHLVRVSAENIEPHPEQKNLGSLVLKQVVVAGEDAWIPDLDGLERMVQGMMS